MAASSRSRTISFAHARFKAARIKSGLTSLKLGKRLSVPGSVVRAWEDGALVPDCEQFFAACAIFGRKPGDFIEGR